MPPALIIHGGAGAPKDGAGATLTRLVEQGRTRLADGANALDVAEWAVNRLEEDETFNAGRGAHLQLDGAARLDAAVMDDQQRCGAVTGLEDVLHPVSVARTVMEDTPHVMLSGRPATTFANEHGFETADLRTDARVQEWETFRDDIDGLSFDETMDHVAERHGSDTVGCVARDVNGGLAAATSTGGLFPQMTGRTGDTPMIGCGTYCNGTAAVSATGVGEAIVRTTLARRCCEHIEDGHPPQAAAEHAINTLQEETGRYAGIIAVDAEGNTGVHHNAPAMPVARRG